MVYGVSMTDMNVPAKMVMVQDWTYDSIEGRGSTSIAQKGDQLKL